MANPRHFFVIFQALLAASYNTDAFSLRGTNYTAADKNTTDSQESNGSCIIPSSDCLNADNSMKSPENAFYGLNGNGALKTNADGIYTYTSIYGEPCDLDVTECDIEPCDLDAKECDGKPCDPVATGCDICINLPKNDDESAYDPARTGFFRKPEIIRNFQNTGFTKDGYIICT